MARRSIFAWTGIVIGLVWAAINAVEVFDAAQIARWPRSPGAVATSTVSSDTIGTAVIKGKSHTDTFPLIEKRLHLTYFYDVNGERYTGKERFEPSDPDALRRPIVVRYNPANPAMGMLGTPVPWVALVEIAVSVAFALGIWIITRPRPSNNS